MSRPADLVHLEQELRQAKEAALYAAREIAQDVASLLASGALHVGDEDARGALVEAAADYTTATAEWTAASEAMLAAIAADRHARSRAAAVTETARTIGPAL